MVKTLDFNIIIYLEDYLKFMFNAFWTYKVQNMFEKSILNILVYPPLTEYDKIAAKYMYIFL